MHRTFFHIITESITLSLWERPARCINDPNICLYFCCFQFISMMKMPTGFLFPKSAIYRGETPCISLHLPTVPETSHCATTSSTLTGTKEKVKKKKLRAVKKKTFLRRVKLFNLGKADLENNLF